MDPEVETLQDQIKALIEVGHNWYKELVHNTETSVTVYADKLNDALITKSNTVGVWAQTYQTTMREYLDKFHCNYKFNVNMPLGAKCLITVNKYEDFEADGMAKFNSLLQEVPTIFTNKDMLVSILESILEGVQLLVDTLVKPNRLLQNKNVPRKTIRYDTEAVISSFRRALKDFDEFNEGCDYPSKSRLTFCSQEWREGIGSEVIFY